MTKLTSPSRQADIVGIDRDIFRDMAGIKTDSVYTRYNIGDEKRRKAAAEKTNHDRAAPAAKVINL